MLVSAVQCSELAVCIHMPPPSWTSLPLPHPALWALTEHWAEPHALCSSFPFAICLTHGSEHTSIPVSQFIPLAMSTYLIWNLQPGKSGLWFMLTLCSLFPTLYLGNCFPCNALLWPHFRTSVYRAPFCQDSRKRLLPLFPYTLPGRGFLNGFQVKSQM